MTRCLRRVWLAAALLGFGSTQATRAPDAGGDVKASGCGSQTISVTGMSGTNEVTVTGEKNSVGGCLADGRPTAVVDCGRLTSTPTDLVHWNVEQCGAGTGRDCVLVDPVTGVGVQVDAMATIYVPPQPGDTPTIWCPKIADLVAPVAVRDQAIRLLPTVPVGTTVGTTGAYTLVNVQTIFWAPTTTVRDLGTVTVAGIPVQLRATLTHAAWNFGDDTTDTTTTPGKAYVPHSCNDAICPGYYGHTYQQDGTKTATLTITWDVDYNPNNTGWQPVATLAGPPATANILVYGTRAILVAPPS